MRKLVFALTGCVLSLNASAQFVAKMEVKEDIPGICNKNNVYALFSFFESQKQAVCPVSKNEILEKLNSQIQFIKDNPKHKDKGMIGVLISCESKVVRCEIDNKTKKPELDKQIEDVFNSLGEWKAGKLNDKNVDSSRLFSFVIKNVKFTFD
jgi:hypothetical protein